ncbi:MAG: chloramphenicol-sensitive protein RarD, partial [Dinoroseobacter sp.]
MTIDAPQAIAPKNEDTAQGLAFAMSAYILWGFLPLYMKMLAHIPAPEIIAHRVIWSVPIAGIVLLILRRTDDLKAALRSPRVLAMGLVTSALISFNWGIYVWAIVNDRTLDTALGYYINPLFSVALGALILKETLSRAQLAAIALAAAAV